MTNNLCCAFCKHRHPMTIMCNMHNNAIDNICKIWCSDYVYVGDTIRNLIILKEHLITYNEVIS